LEADYEGVATPTNLLTATLNSQIHHIKETRTRLEHPYLDIMINTDYGKKIINQQQRVSKGNEYWISDAPTTLSSHTIMLTLITQNW
jgi:hypothetical protein